MNFPEDLSQQDEEFLAKSIMAFYKKDGLSFDLQNTKVRVEELLEAIKHLEENPESDIARAIFATAFYKVRWSVKLPELRDEDMPIFY